MREVRDCSKFKLGLALSFTCALSSVAQAALADPSTAVWQLGSCNGATASFITLPASKVNLGFNDGTKAALLSTGGVGTAHAVLSGVAADDPALNKFTGLNLWFKCTNDTTKTASLTLCFLNGDGTSSAKTLLLKDLRPRFYPNGWANAEYLNVGENPVFPTLTKLTYTLPSRGRPDNLIVGQTAITTTRLSGSPSTLNLTDFGCAAVTCP